MTPAPTTKPFRVHLAVVGIVAVAAAVGIAGIAAYYAVPGNGVGHEADQHASTGEAPRSDGSGSVQRLEAQQKAMDTLFALARDRQETGLTAPITKADEQGISAAVAAVGEPAADANDRAGLLWMFARTCDGYRFVAAGGAVPPFDAGPPGSPRCM